MTPNVMAEKRITALLPHCPGESHASPVHTIVAIMPKAEGLKICLPRKRKIYLEAVVSSAAKRLTGQWLVFNRRQRLSAEMSTLKPQQLIPFFPVSGRKVFCLMDSKI